MQDFATKAKESQSEVNKGVDLNTCSYSKNKNKK